jgi:1D-myo-inositol 3-kinase
MSVAERAKQELQFDYTTVGHVTIDVLEDGSRRAGGTAFYSALQAARLGQRALILTRGVPAEIEALLEPYRAELELVVVPAQQTTTLQTSGSGSERKQRVLAWAGGMPEDLVVDTAILHLAPVAREAPTRWTGHAAFVGLTPQGLVRAWSQPGGEVVLLPPAALAASEVRPLGNAGPAPARALGEEALALARRCDAIVVSEHERTSCAQLISAAERASAVVAVTAGAGATTITGPRGVVSELAVPPVAHPLDDLGAGDVFAAAFFIALSEGRAPAAAGAFATAAAAVRMRGIGAGAIGGRSDIESRRAAAGAAR